jgi:hypothetical protein
MENQILLQSQTPTSKTQNPFKIATIILAIATVVLAGTTTYFVLYKPSDEKDTNNNVASIKNDTEQLGETDTASSHQTPSEIPAAYQPQITASMGALDIRQLSAMATKKLDKNFDWENKGTFDDNGIFHGFFDDEGARLDAFSLTDDLKYQRGIISLFDGGNAGVYREFPNGEWIVADSINLIKRNGDYAPPSCEQVSRLEIKIFLGLNVICQTKAGDWKPLDIFLK